MRIHYGEGVATRTGPESCTGGREAVREALTGEHAGQVLSGVSKFRGADAVTVAEGNMARRVIASVVLTRRRQRPWNVCTSSAREPGDRAATLAAIPAGVSPVGGDCPVDTVVISSGGEGDRTVESLEVKASEREASNSAGCSVSESVSPERLTLGVAEPLRSLGEGRRSS